MEEKLHKNMFDDYTVDLVGSKSTRLMVMWLPVYEGNQWKEALTLLPPNVQ